MNAPPPPWPRLRQELTLGPGPVAAHGGPTYTLHDPAGHRFFRLGWKEMEIITRWSLGSPEAVAQAVNGETTLAITPEDVQKVADFITANSLSQALSSADTSRLKDQAAKGRVSPFMFMVKNYLFLRVTLWNPDRFLARTLPYARPFFSPAFARLVLIMAVVGLALVLRRHTFLTRELEALFSVSGAVMMLAAVGLSKALHELGHAYAAKLSGLKVPAMGLALMCFYPILWTDTTEAWKLARRRDRLLIGLSGVGAELALAAAASIVWLISPPGLLREMALTLTTVTWVTTLTINANPFMRYDAYYILSDLMEMPLIQDRCFAVGKWRLRRLALGLSDPPPELLPPKTLNFMALYAYLTWIYRFFLFIGIAFLVYHMFFKLLGLILFLVEIVWFLAKPIFKELAQWYARRKDARLTPVGASLMAIVICLFIPWRSSVVAPAILEAEHTITFHAPLGARLAAPLPSPGTEAAAGDRLVSLVSPDLDFRLQAVKQTRQSLEKRLANVGLASELWMDFGPRRQELAGAMAEEAGLKARREKLNFKAPFAGRVREAEIDLYPGAWVEAKEELLMLTGGRTLVEAMVAEEDVARLKAGGGGLFLADSGARRYRLKILSISPGAMTELTRPSLASIYGGSLMVRQDPSSGRLWPEHSVYVVRCLAEGEAEAALTGQANFKGQRQSLAARALTFLTAAIIGESGL